MASDEMLKRFDEARALRFAAMTAGVQAHERFLETPREERIGDPVDDPDFTAARIALRAAECELGSLDYPVNS
ncbi:hypothetical protein H7Y63_02740 [Polaromonas sp.]|nr:hypothetical protein [Candidatus Saccharibacteria bacterium]